MALYRNKSNGSVTFYDPRNPFNTAIPPGHVVDEADNPGVANHQDFDKVDDFWTFAQSHPGSRIAIVRSYALGDCLMAYAILRTLQPQLEALDIKIVLFTQRRFYHAFKYLRGGPIDWSVDEKLALVPDVQRSFDVAFSLNGVLERDHALKENAQENRLQMLAKALGVEEIIDT